MIRLDELTLSLYPDTAGKCPTAISTLISRTSLNLLVLISLHTFNAEHMRASAIFFGTRKGFEPS
jgi:hypothetical protein